MAKANLGDLDGADLYEISTDELLDLEGWGEQSADGLLAELEDSREPSLASFLSAIGIPDVGPTVARGLAQHFEDLDALLDADTEELESVEGIGSTMADQIGNFFENERNRDVIERLRDHGVEPERTQADAGDELTDLTVVFTGSVENWTRDELEGLVERHGGDATDSVSGNTDYLVVGENPGETKQDDAEANDVSELDPEELFDLLERRGVDLEREHNP